MAQRISKQEEQWQAESDAQMLARYQELLDDKPRLRRALKQAKKEEENLNKRAQAMARAASMPSKKGK
jgi:hypothetical protein